MFIGLFCNCEVKEEPASELHNCPRCGKKLIAFDEDFEGNRLMVSYFCNCNPTEFYKFERKEAPATEPQEDWKAKYLKAHNFISRIYLKAKDKRGYTRDSLIEFIDTWFKQFSEEGSVE
jgi:hypothetical protein